MFTNAQAANFTVTNTEDSGAGSLRAAIFSANIVGGPDTIDFDITQIVPGSTIYLNSELVITDSVTITGPTSGDPGSIILDAGGTNRHIQASGSSHLSGTTLTLENLTLLNGKANGTSPFLHTGSGGAISTIEVDLNLNHCLLSGNSSINSGGAIFTWTIGFHIRQRCTK